MPGLPSYETMLLLYLQYVLLSSLRKDIVSMRSYGAQKPLCVLFTIEGAFPDVPVL